jgi:CHASE2 domain-containing sensor protein
LNKAEKQKRIRIVALSFVSVLLLLMYGPLAQWFVSADRILYDQLAGGRPAVPLANAYIVSIDPQRANAGEIIAMARSCSDCSRAM